MSYRYFFYHFILVASILLSYVTTVHALEPTIEVQYNLIDTKRISRTVFEYTFKATLINGDTPIKNVSATARSQSSFTTMMDDKLSFNDMSAGETSESTDSFIIQQDRLEAFGPESLSWDVSYEPATQSGLEIDGAIDIRSSTRLRLGKRIELYNGYKFYAKNDEDFSVSVEHKFEPEQGLALSLLTDDVLSSSRGEVVEFVSQYLSATQAGQYTMTTTATILETGEKFTAVTEVLVIEGELPPDIGLLGSWPHALAGNTLTDVLFSVNIDGDFSKVTEAKLKNLQDNSTITLKNSSGSYHETVEINTENMTAGDCLSYQAIFETTLGVYNTNIYKICVTRFPLRFQRVGERSFVTDSQTGMQASADEVIIAVKKGTTEAEVEAIATSINGHVVRTIAELESYQIQIGTAVTTMEELYALIAQLSALPKVKYAAPNALLKLNSLDTTDPLLSVQNHLVAARAREAWFVNRGSEDHIIAIVDSGIDIDHPDLKHKIIGGADLAFPWFEPGDGVSRRYRRLSHKRCDLL